MKGGPKSLNLLLNIVIGVAVVGLLGLFSVAAIMYGRVSSRIKLEEERLELTVEKIDQLKEFAKNLSELSDKARLISRTLPTEKDASRLVSQMESLFCEGNFGADDCIINSISFGNQSAIPEEIKAIALKDPALSQSFSSGDLALLPITVNVRTNYFNFYDKLKALENFSRYVFIGNIRLQSSAQTVTAGIDMFTYYQPDVIPKTAPTKKKAAE